MDYNVAKIRDKIRFFEKTDKIVATNFLTPAEVSEVVSVVKNYDFCLSGGFAEAERRIILIGTTEDRIADFCSVLRIEAFNDNALSHRAVLGSVLGLGIKREMIGDIIITGKLCDIIIMREMKEYILNNLTKIGRENVSIKEATFSDLLIANVKREERTVSVASLRLDAVVSSGFGISREKSAGLINLEKVLVNFLPCKNVAKGVSEGDLISVRGFGRIKVLQVLGETKKGRVRILLEVF
ncbi:MAG: RNA-binding protein [Clostridia bacterium]|nr:RNA-binding protein [Clostridia bacterium]